MTTLIQPLCKISACQSIYVIQVHAVILEAALTSMVQTSVKALSLTVSDPHQEAASATSQYPSASLRGPAALRVCPPENSNRESGSCSARAIPSWMCSMKECAWPGTCRSGKLKERARLDCRWWPSLLFAAIIWQFDGELVCKLSDWLVKDAPSDSPAEARHLAPLLCCSHCR